MRTQSGYSDAVVRSPPNAAMKIAAAMVAGTMLTASTLAPSARATDRPAPHASTLNETTAPDAASGDRVDHHIAKIDGTRFHYVTSGSGDPVLLLPGWPESWIAWRKVLPLLVHAGRHVVVLDPRGFGESDKPATGYDLDTARAICIASWKLPASRAPAESTSLRTTSAPGSRTPTP
jgi:hypothetical protein